MQMPSSSAMEPDAVLAALLHAASLTPTDPAIHRALAVAYRALGRELDARVEDCVVNAIEAGQPLAIYNLATIYFMAGHRAAAVQWYELALTLDPDLAIARRNLATILFDDGRKEEARAHWDRAYRRQCVFVSTAVMEKRRILILAACGYGNVPLKWLLPQQVNTQIQWIIQYTTPAATDTLPRCDLVFNAIGDPDVERPTYAATCDVFAAGRVPALNHPARVSRTRRDRLPALLGGIPDVEIPPVVRVSGYEDAVAALARPDMAMPVLLRPAASHGGEGLVRLDTAEALEAVGWQSAEAWYLCPFRDYRSADGYWRKYRAVFVDREPYPYHMAISSHWLVHYVTADMLSEPAKRAEEQRFLDDPAGMLGVRAMAALRIIADRLDLDYAGVDFTVLRDGRLLVFEANATMLVHPETQAEFAYKNPPVHRIVEAFDAMLTRRIERGAQPVALASGMHLAPA